MSRLAAQAKAEYYPTPLEVVGLISTYLVLPRRKEKDGFVRLLDPCCGEGLALAHLAARLREHSDTAIQTWGSELHPGRAAEAATRLDQALEAPFEAVSWTPTHGVASVLFLNPPYDWSVDAGARRVEDLFLERATPALVVPGGVLVYIIPVSAFYRGAYEALLINYERVRITRFPDPLFDQFKQLVIFGQRRRGEPNWWACHQEVTDLFGHREYLSEQAICDFTPLAPATDPEVYPVPLVKSHRARLWRSGWLEDEVQTALKAHPSGNPFTLPENGPLEVLLEPKRGHIAQLLSSGVMETLVLPGEAIRGRSVPRMVTVDVEDDGDNKRKITQVTQWETHIMRLTQAEGLEHYTGAEALPFLKAHADRLAALLRARLQPYGTQATKAEEALLDTLSQQRARPDGGYGLYPDQRMSAVAMVRSIRRHGYGNLICEMGYGKSTTAGAVVALLNDYPAFLMCPPIMLEKWVRELEATIPGVQAVIVKHVRELQAVIAGYRPGDKLVVIAPQTLVKAGPGWETSVPRRYTLQLRSREESATRKAVFHAAYVAYETLRKQYLEADAAERARLAPELKALRAAALNQAEAYPVCPACGQPLVGRKLDQQLYCKGQVRPALVEEEEAAQPHTCGGALYHYQAKVSRRWPLDLYIKQRAPRFFKMLIVDEVHEYKSGESDRGESFGRLAQVIPHVLALTGTYYGGVSSSIFYLLYRSDPQFRQQWQKHEVQRWIETYGRIQATFTETVSTSAYNARKKVTKNVTEIPGIAPTVLPHILHTTAFRSTADLGAALPPLQDEVVYLGMSDPQRADYRQVENFTWELVRKYRNRYLSSWLQWTLARPNSCWRPEQVEGLRLPEEVLAVPAVPERGELLPKEAWMLHKVQAELAEGRKVLVYLRQTATRDIRQRLLEVFEQGGVTASLLPDSLKAEKREAWVREKQPSVLITHPKRVETGLDLVMYQTAIFYEPEYSLYTLWQAARRLWRLGQDQAVRLYYPVYTDTMEARALELIAKKMTSAQMLYGDDVAGALVDDSVCQGSLAMELLEVLERGEVLAAVQGGLFGDPDATQTWSPVGSPTRTSPSLDPIAAYVTAQGLTVEALVKMNRRARQAVFAPAQGSLWD